MVEKYKSGSCHKVYSLRYKPGTVSLCMASATGALTLLSFAFITIMTIITLVITIIIFITTTITSSSTFTGGLSSAFCKTLLLDVLLQLQFALKFYCNFKWALYWKSLNIYSQFIQVLSLHTFLYNTGFFLIITVFFVLSYFKFFFKT